MVELQITVIFQTFLRGSWADGASKHIFNHKGVIRVGKLTADQTLEDATEHGIELGVEDVEGKTVLNFRNSIN